MSPAPATTCNLTAVAVSLEEITDENREAVLALRVAPAQEQFVSSVRDSLAEAAEYPQAKPWYRAVFADGEPVGFVMVSWNVEPQPPEIIGPWFLWKLLIDERYQGRATARRSSGRSRSWCGPKARRNC